METVEDQRNLQTAVSLHRVGRLGEASAVYRKILQRNPDNHQALHYLGLIEAGGGNFKEAKALIARSLNIRHPNVQFVENYAAVLWQSGDYEAALDASRRGLQADHNNVALSYTAAVALCKLRRFEESVAQFDRLLALVPNHVVALNERGTALAELSRYDAALASIQEALNLQPQYAGARLNLGNLLARLRRYREAIAAYESALKLNAALPDAWLGLGNVFLRLKQPDRALAAFDKALTLQSDSAGAWLGRGNAFNEIKHYAEAVAAFDKALALKPDAAYAAVARLHAKMRLCEWSNFDLEVAGIEAAIGNGVLESPFPLLAISKSAQSQLECATAFAAAECSTAGAACSQGKLHKHRRIRIAYLSADYGDQPTFLLLGGVLAAHDRDRFETIAVSFGAATPDQLSARLTGSFDLFLDVKDRSDNEIANLLREHKIDIAIDLMGYTTGSRPAILAHRAVPLQINYLGYPGTMGAGFIDYIIGDRFVVPEESRRFYSEKIIYMPDMFQANDTERTIGEVSRHATTRVCLRTLSCFAPLTTPTRSRRQYSKSGCAFSSKRTAASCGFWPKAPRSNATCGRKPTREESNLHG